MHAIAQQLDEVLSRLDPKTAADLERSVRDAVAKATTQLRSAKDQEKDEMGYPKGYFDEVVGSLEGQPFDYPTDPPLEPPAIW